jgi:hypothetical protein
MLDIWGRIRQSGYWWCHYSFMMCCIDVLINFPRVDFEFGYSAPWSGLFLVPRSDACSAYSQPWQVFLLLNLLRINLSHLKGLSEYSWFRSWNFDYSISYTKEGI